MTHPLRLIPLVALLMTGACTTVPSGPGVMVLPGSGKSFDQFRADDFDCQQFASTQTGGTTPGQAATDSGVTSAAVGAVVGAAAGAALSGGRGAAVGAGTGLAVGALAGTGTAEGSTYSLQRRYDIAYIQCMYAKGHKVPVSGNLMSTNPSPATPYTPPPPPGSPPPPPPGAAPPR